MTTQHSDHAIREQAYFLWEKDGRPHGREHEYWARAQVAVAEKPQMDTLTAPPPKKAKSEPMVASGKVKAEAKEKLKASPKLRAAASKSKAAPAKAGKAGKPKKK
ncbi:MAG: DUF2934 domain-containing protein [Devosia sp.]